MEDNPKQKYQHCCGKNEYSFFPQFSYAFLKPGKDTRKTEPRYLNSVSAFSIRVMDHILVLFIQLTVKIIAAVNVCTVEDRWTF